ncbi:unnamed protein product [Absidia cylindrospora]
MKIHIWYQKFIPPFYLGTSPSCYKTANFYIYIWVGVACEMVASSFGCWPSLPLLDQVKTAPITKIKQYHIETDSGPSAH